MARLSRKLEGELRTVLGITVFDIKIRKNITVAEAPVLSKDNVKFAPKCNDALDYMAFTDKPLGRFGLLT